MITDETEGKKIKSAETVFDILECIRELDGAGVSEVARQLDYSKSTIHYYLQTLEQRGYLHKEEGKHRLGLRLVNLGENARQQHDLFDFVEPKTEELAAETGMAAHAAAEDGGKAIFLSKAANGDEVATHVGMKTDLHCTAYGKAILAHMSEEAVDRIVGQGNLPQWTEHTVSQRADLDRQLETIRDVDIAYANQEFVEGTSSIAAPILDDATNEVYGAIGISGAADRITDPRKHIKIRRFSGEYRELVERSARIVSERIAQT